MVSNYLLRTNHTHLRVKLNLAKIKLRLRHEKPTERILRQQLDNKTQIVCRLVGIAPERIFNHNREYVAEHALSGVASRPHGEVQHRDRRRLREVAVVLPEHRLEPLLGDGPVGAAAALLLAVGHRLPAAHDLSATVSLCSRCSGCTDGRGGGVSRSTYVGMCCWGRAAAAAV